MLTKMALQSFVNHVGNFNVMTDVGAGSKDESKSSETAAHPTVSMAQVAWKK
jgi:hypothetical protein